MSLLPINLNPTDRQLRQFGVVSLVALPLVAWLWTRSPAVIVWCAVAGLLLAVLGWTSPKSLRPVFVAISLLAIPIGIVVGELALIVIYFGLILPMAIAMRILGRDALSRGFLRGEASYWVPRVDRKDVRRYYRQY